MSSVSTIGQSTFLNTQILGIESTLDNLSNQISSGKKSTDFAGISTVSQLSLQLTNAQTTTQGYLTNISNAGTVIAPVQSILQQVTDIANQLRNDALNASSDTLPVTQGNGALQAEAQDALNQISALLNTKVGNAFLFGGRVTSAPPMPNFGSIANASSIVGQVAGLNSSIPLNANTSSGDQLYNAIQAFLRNGVTYPTPAGGTAPSALGYSGETGEPGGSAYRLTSTAAITQDTNTVTVNQTADLPVPGQYIEFGTVPPQNTIYKITNVTGQTITFQRVPPTGIAPFANDGVDAPNGTLPAGTSINVISPTAVTTMPTPATVSDTTDPLVGTAAVGATSIQVATISSYHVGDRIAFNGAGTADYYDVTFVDPATSTISFVQAGVGSGGITAATGAVAAGQAITIVPGQPPGSTVINLASTSNVTAGMSVKFGNSSTVYHVVRIISGTSIEVTQEGTSQGAGLTDPLPPSVTSLNGGTPVPGTDVTAVFGAQIPTQSVQVDNGVSMQYGIRANDPAFQKVLGAIFALATTTLNTTTQAGFRQVAARAAADLKAGSAQITQVASTLGVKQQTLDATQQRLNDFNTTLQSQLSNLNDVDMAAAVSKLTETQTQLQASFQLLSTMKNLTLANYL